MPEARPAGPRGYRVVPLPDAELPRPDAVYTGLLRTGQPSVDVPRLLMAVLFGVTGYLVVVPLVTRGVIWLWWAAGSHRRTFDDFLGRAARFEAVAGLVGAHLGLAMLIPISLVVLWAAGGVPARYLVSVTGRLRGGYLALCLLVAAVVLNAAYWLPRWGHAPALTPQAQLTAFLTAIVVTSPLQAVAEEFFFRGLLLQALGGLAVNRWVGIVGSALLFALAHGVQNHWLFADRFAFGLLAGWLVVRTGGLEAGIAAHVVNNLFAFTYGALFSSVAELVATREMTWQNALLDVAGFATFALAAAWLAHRLRLAVRTPASASNLKPGR